MTAVDQAGNRAIRYRITRAGTATGSSICPRVPATVPRTSGSVYSVPRSRPGTAAGSWIHPRTPVRSMLFAGHTRRTRLGYYGGVVSFQRTDNAFSNVRAVKFLDMVAYAARQLS